MPKVQLASRRLQTGGSSRGISPVMLSGSIGQIANAAINSRAGDVYFTPTPRHEVVLDTTLDSASQAASVFEQAAFKYNERVADAKAQSAYSNLETKISAELNAFEEQLGQSGVEGYKSFAEKIQTIQAQALDAQDPFTKSKLVLQTNSLTSHALQKGASHSAKQLRVWQGQIEDNKNQKTQVKIFEASPNEEEFDTLVGQRLQELAIQYAGQDDVIELKQTEFKNTAFANTIESHTWLGNFAMAGSYLDKASKAKLDPVMLTKLADHLQNQMKAVDNAKMTALFNEHRLTEIKQQQEFVAIYNKLEANHAKMSQEEIDAMIQQHPNPEYRHKLAAAVPEMLAGRPFNVLDERRLVEDRAYNLDNLSTFFERYPNINMNELLKEYNKLTVVKSGKADTMYKQIENYIDSIIPKDTSITAKYSNYEQRAEPVRQQLKKDYLQRIELALNQNEDLNLVTEEWKNKQVTSQWLQATNVMKVPYTSLVPVTDITNTPIDMLSLKQRKDLSPRLVKAAHAASLVALNKKYNFPDTKGLSDIQIKQVRIAWAKANPDKYAEFKIDLQRIMTQNEYFRQKLQHKPTDSDGSLNPNAGK